MRPLLAFLAVLAALSARAGVSPLPGSSGHLDLAPYVEVLEDSGGKLVLDDVRAAPWAGRFRPAGSGPINFGYTDSAWWLRFALPGDAAPRGDLLLEVAFPSIDRIELHEPVGASGPGPRYSTRLAGDTFPWDAREIRHRNYVFRLSPPAAPGAQVYYMRVASRSTLTVPLTLWRTGALEERDEHALLILGLFYGLVVALVAYNLMLYFAVQDRVYLIYVLYAACFGNFLFAYDGLAFRYLWPGSTWAANHAVAMLLALTLTLGALFAHSFLDMRRTAPRAGVAMRAVVGVGALLAPSAALGWPLDYGAVLRAITVLAVGTAAIATFVAVRAMLAGFRPARFFLLAWAALLVFIAIGALRNFALVPTTFVGIYGLHIGFALDVLLLSFALGDRINLLRRERTAAQAEALEAQRRLLEATRESERGLEARIAERTAELNRVNERLLAEAHERESLMQLLRHQEEHLRFMAQHDPLTGLPNRMSMQQRLSLAMEIAKRNRKKVAVMLLDLDGFKAINDTRGHRAGDQALVQLAGRLRTSVRGSDTVARYGGDEFVILAGELDRGADASMIAEKVTDMVQVPLALEGGPIRVSCSIGISVFPDDGEDAEQLIALADKAMYATRSGAGQRYAFAAPPDRA
jgi:diguanylate cyclase (GGDEF)-like protein